MNDQQRCLNDINREDGSSSWLTTIPLKDEGYILNKQLFWDLLRIRYGWAISRLPEKCSCGVSFDLNHALSRKKGGFITIQHNHIRSLLLLKTDARAVICSRKTVCLCD